MASKLIAYMEKSVSYIFISTLERIRPSCIFYGRGFLFIFFGRFLWLLLELRRYTRKLLTFCTSIAVFYQRAYADVAHRLWHSFSRQLQVHRASLHI